MMRSIKITEYRKQYQLADIAVGRHGEMSEVGEINTGGMKAGGGDN